MQRSSPQKELAVLKCRIACNCPEDRNRIETVFRAHYGPIDLKVLLFPTFGQRPGLAGGRVGRTHLIVLLPQLHRPSF